MYSVTKILIFSILSCISVVKCSLSSQNTLVSVSNLRNQPNKSIDAMFSSLPSQSDLQQIIYSADAVSLTRLLQIIQIKNQVIACDALAVYSDSIIGIIKSAKHRKQLLISQLEVLYETAKSEITRITQQLNKLKQKRDGLKINELRNQILFMVIELDTSYNTVNDLSDKVEIFQAQIVGYRKDVEDRTNQTIEKRKLLLEKKLQISGLDSQIVQIERNLANLKQKRVSVVQDAEKIQSSISQHTKQINLGRQKIAGLQRAISQNNQKIDFNKRKASQLQINLQRMRTTLASSINKDNILTSQIQALEKQLIVQTSRLLQREFDALANMVKVWGLFLPKFQKQNAKLYYECFGAGSIDTLQTGNVAVYVIKGVNLPNYLLNNYGVSSTQSLRKDMQFFVVDIFGNIWKNRYGDSFALTKPQLQSSELYLQDDFTCLNPSLVQSGEGQIVSIRNRSIIVKDDQSKQVQIYIGACSRIQSTTVVPNVGQTIYYKGIYQNGSPTVNLYTASCF